jgi:hypothetical protein
LVLKAYIYIYYIIIYIHHSLDKPRTVAGVFDFETGLRLVKFRGEAMQQAAEAPGPRGLKGTLVGYIYIYNHISQFSDI